MVMIRVGHDEIRHHVRRSFGFMSIIVVLFWFQAAAKDGSRHGVWAGNIVEFAQNMTADTGNRPQSRGL
ncbi:hypothetical protein IF2G_05242 [Cordyceps javanica]|nr:hypothetical protein IF2G_05242 [Cordyceps javanica]